MATEAAAWTIGEAEGGARVDQFVATRLGVSRAAVRRLIDDGSLRVDGRLTRKGQRLQPGERVTLRELPPTETDLRPTGEAELTLVVLYEDADLVALAKPAGQPSHPLRAGERGTAANALCARFPECAAAGQDPREGGLVHRLDIGTTGVLLAARSPNVWTLLRAAFRAGQVQKDYLALVVGAPHLDRGSIDAPLEARGGRSVASDLGQPALTEWTVIERLVGGWTLLRAHARTGRMHQIRAHLAHADLPIVGDAQYGGPESPGLIGHFLHACRIELEHPTTGAPLVVEAPLPDDRQALLARLRSA